MPRNHLVNFSVLYIFTTAYPQFALQAFEKEAFDYLLKPIDYERFLKCIQRIKRKWLRSGKEKVESPSNFFNVKSEIKGRMVRIKFEEVVYIEGAVNYIQIHTVNGKHMTYLTLKEVLQHLPDQIFTRIHRSFVINVNFVRVIERNRVGLDGGHYLPLGDNYKQQFLDDMDDNLLSSDRAS